MSRRTRRLRASRPHSRRIALAAFAVAGLLAAGCGSDGPEPAPQPSGVADDGRTVFAASCAGCHGVAGRGTPNGPPLVDRIYEPSHHSDAAFVLAVRRGSPEHHWGFGDMPPVQGIDDRELADTIAYVRRLQQDAGIR